MKICFLCHNICSYGGTERIVSSLLKELTKLGCECYALSMCKKESLFFDFSDFIKIEYLFKSGNKIAVMHDRVKRIRLFLKNNKIDVLITVGGHLNYYGWRSKGRCKWIAWEHEMFDFNKSTYVKLSKFLGIKKADEVVVLTNYDKKRYSEKWKKLDYKVHVIGNFTDSNYIKTETENKIVIAVGRLWNIKQFNLLIEAWALLHNEVPDWKLIILGEGTERERLESIVRNNNINNVLLPGNKSNIMDYYKEADIFTITSIAEGFSLVLLEAMAHSLPVVGFYSHGGVEELVKADNGILVKQGDVHGLAFSLRELINNPDMRSNMGKASYARSLNFLSNTIVDKWVIILGDKDKRMK